MEEKNMNCGTVDGYSGFLRRELKPWLLKATSCCDTTTVPRMRKPCSEWYKKVYCCGIQHMNIEEIHKVTTSFLSELLAEHFFESFRAAVSVVQADERGKGFLCQVVHKTLKGIHILVKELSRTCLPVDGLMATTKLQLLGKEGLDLSRAWCSAEKSAAVTESFSYIRMLVWKLCGEQMFSPHQTVVTQALELSLNSHREKIRPRSSKDTDDEVVSRADLDLVLDSLRNVCLFNVESFAESYLRRILKETVSYYTTTRQEIGLNEIGPYIKWVSESIGFELRVYNQCFGTLCWSDVDKRRHYQHSDDGGCAQVLESRNVMWGEVIFPALVNCLVSEEVATHLVSDKEFGLLTLVTKYQSEEEHLEKAASSIWNILHLVMEIFLELPGLERAHLRSITVMLSELWENSLLDSMESAVTAKVPDRSGISDVAGSATTSSTASSIINITNEDVLRTVHCVRKFHEKWYVRVISRETHFSSGSHRKVRAILSKEYFDALSRAFGSERLLFRKDGPKVSTGVLFARYLDLLLRGVVAKKRSNATIEIAQSEHDCELREVASLLRGCHLASQTGAFVECYKSLMVTRLVFGPNSEHIFVADDASKERRDKLSESVRGPEEEVLGYLKEYSLIPWSELKKIETLLIDLDISAAFVATSPGPSTKGKEEEKEEESSITSGIQCGFCVVPASRWPQLRKYEGSTMMIDTDCIVEPLLVDYPNSPFGRSGLMVREHMQSFFRRYAVTHPTRKLSWIYSCFSVTVRIVRRSRSSSHDELGCHVVHRPVVTDVQCNIQQAALLHLLGSAAEGASNYFCVCQKSCQTEGATCQQCATQLSSMCKAGLIIGGSSKDGYQFPVSFSKRKCRLPRQPERYSTSSRALANDLDKTVALQRKAQLEAKIVRLAKSRRQLKFQELLSECFVYPEKFAKEKKDEKDGESTKETQNPQCTVVRSSHHSETGVSEIRKIVDGLIQREFLRREGTDMIVYLA